MMKMKEYQAIRDIQNFGEEGGVVPVIDVAATSTFLNPKDMERVFEGDLEGCYLYSRHSNPTVQMFGRKLAAMEGAEAALGVASGMASIACTIEQLMPEGGHIVASKTVYGGTYALLANLLPKRGIRTTFVNPEKVDEFEKAIQSDTKVIYTETMSNPMLAVSDLASLSKVAHQYGAKLVVDNTFTPMIVSPMKFGADVVIHSCTKYISGASDMIAGVIAGSKEFIQSLIDVNQGVVMLTGPVMDPKAAHELYLRLDHLGIRMSAHSKSGAALATVARELGLPTIYPGLKDHPQHELMKKMMNPGYGFGGMVTLDCGSLDKATEFASKLQMEKFGLFAVSLGFSRTLMSCPAASTSSEIPVDERTKMGLTQGLLRLSIGFVGDDEVMAERFKKCYIQVFKK